MRESPSGESLGPAVAALVATQLLFGLHYSVAREITARLDPVAWTALRGLLGALVFALLMLALRRPWPRGAATWRRLVVLGVLGVALNQLLFNAGIARSTAIHAVLLMATVPAQTLALGVLLGQETLTGRKLASVLLGLLGVGVLMRVDALAGAADLLLTRDGRPAAHFAETMLCGDLMIFTNATCYALYIALGKETTRTMPALTLCAGIYAVGGLLAAAIGGPSLLQADLGALSPQTWGWIAFVVAGPTVGAYLLNLYALRRLSSSLVGLAINLQFLIAVAIGVWWHDEVIEVRVVAAGALVLGGLALRILPARPPRPA